jgi:serine phosphatase RsbU (regulator of sigma subunit)
MSNTAHLLATVNLVLGGLVFLLGLVILRENPAQRLNRVVSMLLFFGGFGAVLSALSLLFPKATAGAGLQDNFAYLWELFFPTVFLLASIFPEERPFTRPFVLPWGWRTPGFTILVYTPHVFHFLLVLLVAVWKPDPASVLSTPLILKPVVGVIGVFARLFLNMHRSLFSLVDLMFGAGAVALLMNSWRRTRVTRIRQQSGAIAVGLAGCLALYASATCIPTLIGRPLDRSLQATLTTVALILGSGGIAYAMVRHKFLDAKLIARRGILYALASAVMIGVYLLIVERVNKAVAGAFGLDARVIEPVLLIMALTLFQPVIARLEESLDQMFLRDPADYRNVLRQLGRDLQTTIDLEDLLNRSIRTLTETLLLRRAYIVAITADGPTSRAGAGEALSAEQMQGIVALLPRLSPTEASFRLSDPVDGLRRLDRELLVRTLGVELMVPLRWRGETLGVVLLGEKLTATEYTSEDVSLLNTLGSQMAVSLQNALLLRDRLRTARMEDELQLAHTIQQTFLRTEAPPQPHCDVHAVNIPSRQVGGDYYDLVVAEDGSFYIAIADVAGKGVPAALMSSMLQAGVRTQARSGGDTNTILRNVNALIYRSSAVHQFATFFLARVDATGTRLDYCNAGHNYPVLVRADGTRVFLEKGGTILGIMEALRLEQASVALQPGDTLVMYTDGLSEAADLHGELYSDEQIVEFVAALPRTLPAEEVATRLLGSIESHLNGIEAQDDRTVLVMRIRERAGAPKAQEPEPEAAAIE